MASPSLLPRARHVSSSAGPAFPGRVSYEDLGLLGLPRLVMRPRNGDRCIGLRDDSGGPSRPAMGTGRAMPSRRSRLRGTAVVVVAALATIASSSLALASPDRPLDRPKLQQRLDRLVAAGAPGVVALVREHGRTATLTSGYANVATHERLRARDRFRVGSLTKSFVSTVILQLVGEGTLTLDDTVVHWLPGKVPNGQAITVR